MKSPPEIVTNILGTVPSWITNYFALLGRYVVFVFFFIVAKRHGPSTPRLGEDQSNYNFQTIISVPSRFLLNIFVSFSSQNRNMSKSVFNQVCVRRDVEAEAVKFLWKHFEERS